MLRAVSLTLVLLLLTACGGGGGGNRMDRGMARADLAGVLPAVADGPYVSVLKKCATATRSNESCSLDTLPPLGMDTIAPTVDDIMQRALVSHPWMATRLRELLEALPEDIHLLARGVTAIVIDGNIRPSYYTSLTGAIYLDPESLWLSADEQAVINPAPDYRHGFSAPMAFRSLWRYVAGGEEAIAHSSPSQGRTLEQIVPQMAALLFHELAHANDDFPPAAYAQADTRQSILQVIRSLESSAPSIRLAQEQGLQSLEMQRMAQILYRGQSATDGERQISAAEVGEYFDADGASDDYAYTSRHEDLAMLFEEAMMKIHFNIDRDIAFTDRPAGAQASCDDYRVAWGVRNRVGADWVMPRAEWVARQLLPERDYSAEFAALPQPQSLPVGLGWCASATALQPESAFKPFALSAPSADTQLPLYHTLRPHLRH